MAQQVADVTRLRCALRVTDVCSTLTYPSRVPSAALTAETVGTLRMTIDITMTASGSRLLGLNTDLRLTRRPRT